MTAIRLGLIGDNIGPSRAPELHRACGRLMGVEVRYDLLIPAQLGLGFDAVFDKARDDGLTGVNVTLPYKERVLARLGGTDRGAARVGAVNTVRFGAGAPAGFNTDHSGFVAAWRARFGEDLPGRVVLFGAGGAGKAVAVALADLGARQIVIVDPRAAVAEALAEALGEAGTGPVTARPGGLPDLAVADGVVNCTPLGMHGYPGSPVPDGAFPAGAWAFDAVYTPMETPFRAQALSAGAAFLSGYELFFHQGIQAFEIFTGVRVDDPGALRALLDAPAV